MKSVWTRLPVSPAVSWSFPLPEMSTTVGGRCTVMAHGPYREPAGEDPGEWKKARVSATLSVTAGVRCFHEARFYHASETGGTPWAQPWLARKAQ